MTETERKLLKTLARLMSYDLHPHSPDYMFISELLKDIKREEQQREEWQEVMDYADSGYDPNE